jgi:type I restriction enzyme S subunit
MIAELSPYPEYKTSRYEWLGPFPSHWDLLRAKYLFREVDERSTTGGEELLSVSHLTGVTPRSQKTITMFLAKSTVGHKICRPGDAVINTMWAWMGALGVARHTGIVSPAYGVYRPLLGCGILPRYAHHLLRTPTYAAEYQRRSTGVNSSRLRLYSEHFLRIAVVIPPLREQAAIVHFLDWAHGRLERAIRAKRKVIALLNEQKQAIIHRAVTRGLDPSVPLKPSGISWLGDIPRHWDVVRNKAVCRLGTGHTPSRRVARYWRDCSIPWVTLSDVKQFRNDQILHITKTQENVSEIGILNSAAVRLPVGTVILSRTASVGFSVILGREMATSQDFMAWTPGPRVVGTYLLFVLRAMRDALRGLMHGSTHKTIYMPTLHGLRMPLPPVDEQRSIAAAVEAQLRVFDPSVQATEREIELLREYRTRLVADVVTGRLDVREAAARLPDAAAPDAVEDDAVEDDADLGDETEAADEEAAV